MLQLFKRWIKSDKFFNLYQLFLLHCLTLFIFYFTDERNLYDMSKIRHHRALYLEILLYELENNRGRNQSLFNNRNEIQIWLDTCCLKLKQLNYEHAKILIEQKPFVQYPDLYAELYNL